MIDESRARRLLPHVWHAFFGRFGRLTTTQQVAIEPVVDGASVVLCAPTASGKTEALLGPMIERSFRRDADEVVPAIVVVCPTRALCNDLHRRIEKPVGNCGLRSDIKTGDSPSFPDDDPPEVLVTTPESLDSMLSRRPAALRGVEGLVLDELHLLDGDPRGDHLRALVSRLGAVCSELQICAASATAAQSERLADEFAGSRGRVVTAEGERDSLIEPRLVEATTLVEAVDIVADEVDGSPGSKLLVFANTRAEVEWMAANLGGTRTFAHHGSLSKAERLRTETNFLRAPSGVCVATMTLELGIDIGDVDRVVLLNPPPNVASFSQRIGRSNRRGGPIQTTCLYSTPFDRTRFEHMIECAEEGRLFPEKIRFRPSILPQQAVSLLFQNPDRWVSAGALHARLPPGVRPFWTVADCRAVLEEMRDEGYLYADSRGHYVADEPAQRQFEYGQIHAHIESDPEVEVVDEATGRRVGTVNWSDDEQGRGESGGSNLLLAGEHRRVTRVRDRRVYVEAGKLEGEPEFLSRMGPRYSFELTRDLARFVGIGDDEIRLLPEEAGVWRAHHFLGTLWGKLWAGVMSRRGFRVTKVGAFFAECRRSSGSVPRRLGSADEIEDDACAWLDERYRTLLDRLQVGPWKRFVPDDMLRRWVTDCLGPDEFADRMATMELVEHRIGPDAR